MGTVGLVACGGREGADAGGRPTLVATIHPAAMIAREVVGDVYEVRALIPPGASPHTYEPRPSDVERSERAAALIMIDPTLDGWAARLPAQKKIPLFDLVNEADRMRYDEDFSHEHGHDQDQDHEHEHEHEHAAGSWDAHFWSDPVIVKSVAMKLADELAKLNPKATETFRANAARFGAELDALDAETREALKPVEGAPVFLFHPSLRYFLKRYGLRMAGTLEPSPGKDPTPRAFSDLIKRVKESDAPAIFSEPQLPSRSAEALAEAAGVRLMELDPNGGVEGRFEYSELIRYNARVLIEAFGREKP